jgi:hypothetical protein
MNEAEKIFLNLIERGFFSIDSTGAIWRHKRYVRGHNGSSVEKAITRKRADKPMKIGYRQVSQTWRRQVYCVLAHRLVWIYFFGDIPDNLEVNHKDGVKSNNCPSNLELVTRGENIEHAYQTGLREPAPTRGEDSNLSKLSETVVRSILLDWQTGQYSQKDLATKYGQSKEQIHLIVRRKSWAHVQI